MRACHRLTTRVLACHPLTPQDGYSAQGYIENVVEKIRQSVYGAESTEPLDLVQLYWWDLKVSSLAQQVCQGRYCKSIQLVAPESAATQRATQLLVALCLA